jgi:hypothetical protein
MLILHSSGSLCSLSNFWNYHCVEAPEDCLFSFLKIEISGKCSLNLWKLKLLILLFPIYHIILTRYEYYDIYIYIYIMNIIDVIIMFTICSNVTVGSNYSYFSSEIYSDEKYALKSSHCTLNSNYIHVIYNELILVTDMFVINELKISIFQLLLSNRTCLFISQIMTKYDRE